MVNSHISGAPAAERLRMKEVQMKAVGEHNTYEEQRSRTVKRQEVPSAIDAYTARILDDGDEPPLTENYGARFVDLPIDLAAEEFL
ncbi:unnamed protein product [Toxocara canis]|uniref:Prevent-host-death protein n=1 Tax=Toxocara canis TaxID=6265 RepID=A0A183V1A0_TOXCA|nr:unnamed protein product [Toxocara canis]